MKAMTAIGGPREARDRGLPQGHLRGPVSFSIHQGRRNEPGLPGD